MNLRTFLQSLLPLLTAVFAIPTLASPIIDAAAVKAAQARGAIIWDVRATPLYRKGHIPGARHLARGQLELRINDLFPDPTVRILACCEFGKISTLAAATLKQLGFMRAVALDGGMKAWKDAGYALEV